MHNFKIIILFPFILEIIIVFSSFNYKRKYFYLYSCIFLNLFSKRNECIFKIKIDFFLFKYFKVL